MGPRGFSVDGLEIIIVIRGDGVFIEQCYLSGTRFHVERENLQTCKGKIRINDFKKCIQEKEENILGKDRKN